MLLKILLLDLGSTRTRWNTMASASWTINPVSVLSSEYFGLNAEIVAARFSNLARIFRA
jgi:hypothetical protein